MRRLLTYVLGPWPLLAVVGASIAAASLLELAVPWVIGFLLIDGAVKERDLSRLPGVALLLLGIFVAQRGFSFVKDYVQELANQRILHRLRCDVYERLMSMRLASFDRSRAGELLSRATSDVDTAEGLLGFLMQDVGNEVLTLAGTVGFLWAVNRELTLYLLPTVVALGASVFFFKPTVRRYARRVRDLVGQMAAVVGETIHGIRVVKLFRGERYELGRLAVASQALVAARTTTARLQWAYSTSVEAWAFGGTITAILVAAPWVVGGTMTVGALVAYLSYVTKLYGPVKKLSKVNLSIQKIIAAGDRIFELMSEPVEEEAALAKQGASPNGARANGARAPLGEIRFERVRFSYERGRPVLDDLNLTIPAGRMFALVGASGGGKTTIVSLLLRLYRPDSGRILLGGVDLQSIPLETVRRLIAVVPQETFLFSGSVFENIAYALPSASVDQVIAAAKAAHAHDFIQALPQGYQTQLGERGVNLSAGQRQRLAVARALLRDPAIIVFDEATSNLDSESEHLIQEAVERLAVGRTVIVIAHRLSTVRRADQILVIERGRIAESGPHHELVARNGIYSRLCELQFGLAERDSLRKWGDL